VVEEPVKELTARRAATPGEIVRGSRVGLRRGHTDTPSHQLPGKRLAVIRRETSCRSPPATSSRTRPPRPESVRGWPAANVARRRADVVGNGFREETSSFARDLSYDQTFT